MECGWKNKLLELILRIRYGQKVYGCSLRFVGKVNVNYLLLWLDTLWFGNGEFMFGGCNTRGAMGGATSAAYCE